MRLTPPKVVTFWIAVILGVLGILGWLGMIAMPIWLLVIGFILLVLACLLKGL